MSVIIDNYVENYVKSMKESKNSYELIHSLEVEQMIQPETAQFLATKTYFLMLGLPLKLNPKVNAEFMSPGELPFLVDDKELIAGFHNITIHLDNKGLTLWDESLDEKLKEANDVECYKINKQLSNIELYLYWIDETIYKKVTSVRYTFPFPWPLNRFQCWKKFQSVKKALDLDDYLDKSYEQVLQDLEETCTKIDLMLANKKFVNGDHPTKCDAIIFGHFFSLLTTILPKEDIAETIRSKCNIVRFCQDIESLYFKRKNA